MSPAVRRRPTRPAVLAPVTLHEFEALDRTHADVVQSLKQLEALVKRIDDGGVDETARRLAATLCAFFDGTARAHHEEEERVVFPPLLGGGDAALIQHVQRLQQDHGWLEEDWHELRPQLSTIAEGFSWNDREALRQMAEVFATLYIEHIALEESMIYPAARALLESAEQAEQRRTAPPP
jgi:hemerythrin-like domain-containing protein